MLDNIDSLLTVRKGVLDVLDETRGVKNLTLLPKTRDVLDDVRFSCYHGYIDKIDF